MPFSSKEKRITYQREYSIRNREKLRAMNLAWRLKNRDALKVADREKYERNRAGRIAAQIEYYRRNHETRLAWHREYRKNNRERLTAQRKTDAGRLALAERQARRRTAISTWANETLVRRFYAEAKAKTMAAGVEHVVDHIVPLINPPGLWPAQRVQFVCDNAPRERA